MIYLESEKVEQILLFHNFFTVQSRIFFTELMITLLIPEIIIFFRADFIWTVLWFKLKYWIPNFIKVSELLFILIGKGKCGTCNPSIRELEAGGSRVFIQFIESWRLAGIHETQLKNIKSEIWKFEYKYKLNFSRYLYSVRIP